MQQTGSRSPRNNHADIAGYYFYHDQRMQGGHRDVFTFVKLITETATFSVWEVKDKDDTPYIIKRLKDRSDVQSFVQLRREYDLLILMSAACSHFLKPLKYIEGQFSASILWPKEPLVSLREFLHSQPLSQSVFLNIARQLTKGLYELHSKGIMHRNINSENILIDPPNVRVYISGLECATYWKEQTTQSTTNVPTSDSFQYMSPEQTGKIERPVDFRSDLYSLGIVFYEILSGQPPFIEITSPMALLYAHVGVEIPPLHLLSDLMNPVSPVVGHIVQKLLQKDIDNRYQSAYGLLHDISSCGDFLDVLPRTQRRRSSLSLLLRESKTLKQKSSERRYSMATVTQETDLMEQLEQIRCLQATQPVITPGEDPYVMELGCKDKRSFLSTSSKHYGLEENIALITRSYNNCGVSRHSFSVLIEGYAGSGKTTL